MVRTNTGPRRFDWAGVKTQFPIFARYPDLHYLDNAATTQCPRRVIDAVARHDSEARANVSRGVYRLAERATDAYEQARQVMARYVGATDPCEVVFTAGTTAAINLAALALAGTWRAGDEVVVSLAEHHSNLVPWQLLARRQGIRLRYLPVADDGHLELDALDQQLGRRCRLVAITHASNVTGAVTDVERVVDAARSVGARVLLDGAQMAPQGPLDVTAMGVDLYAFSGHKMYAPNGVGVWWARRELLESLPPAFGGGGMVHSVSADQAEYAALPARFEAGTPPIAQAVGLAAAAEWILEQDHALRAAHLRQLTDRLLAGLADRRGVRVIGPASSARRIGVVSFDVAGAHTHDVCQVMDTFGVAVRGGHHCAQPLMARYGLRGSTRVGLAAYNNDADIDALLAALDHAIGVLR